MNEIFWETPSPGENEDWVGIYLNEEKIGYGYHSYQNAEKGILFKQFMLMRIPLGGAVREVSADNFALLDSTLAIKSFSSGMTSGEYDITIHGLVSKDNLELSYISGGKSSAKNIRLSDPLYFQGQVSRLVKQAGFNPGRFSIPVFDPLSLNVSDLNVEVGNFSISEGDTVYPIGLTLSGIETVMTVDVDGRVVSEDQPGGMMMKRESRNEALKLKTVFGADEDFLVKLSVPSSAIIENPREASYFKAILEDIDAKQYELDDKSTQLLVDEHPITIEIDRENKRQVDYFTLQPFLKSTDFIQADDPDIRKVSKSICEGHLTDKEKAFAISDWVYKNIEIDFAVSVPSAIEVLRVKRGDSNEHTALYTALARAAGIPSKIVTGIVYKGGVFYYYAWPAVYLGYWHQLDPTLGQHTADATHIQLLEGCIGREAELVNVLGKLKVKVVDCN